MGYLKDTKGVWHELNENDLCQTHNNCIWNSTPVEHKPINDSSGYVSCTCGNFPPKHFAHDDDKWAAWDKHVANSSQSN